MSITLDAIIFNHEQGGFNSNALNLRQNGTRDIQFPEWRPGVTSEQSAAAYARTGSPVTIKAQFSSSDPVFEIEIRALDESTPGPSVLGDIERQTINFGFGLQTDFETIRLDNTRLSNANVGTHIVKWRWQAREPLGGAFTDIGVTTHKIYTVIERPNEPWQQSPFISSNLQLPWTDVLDFACRWARGAHNLDEAATLITQSVHALGPEVINYNGAGAGESSYTRQGEFLCEHFLRLLRGEANHKGHGVNCSDCATVVSTFANILGCALSQARMGGKGFNINLIQPVGFTEWSHNFTHGGFTYHEVAWKGNCDVDDEVFDACLKLDRDNNPMAAPHTPLLAVNMRFGRTGEGLYRDMLAQATDFGRPLCDPLKEKAHRKLRNPLAPEFLPLGPEMFAMLAETFNFQEWRNFNALSENLFVWNFDLFRNGLPGWHLEEAVEVENQQGVTHSVETIWSNRDRGKGAMLCVDVYDCESRGKAHDFLLELLGEFPVSDLPKPPSDIGDVAFTVQSLAVILFARANFAISVRDVSREPQSVVDISLYIDRVLTALPEDVEDLTLVPDAALLIPPALGYQPGEVVPLIHDPHIAKQSRTGYRFFSLSGEFRVINGSPHYLPKGSGEQKVSAYAVSQDGRVGGLRYEFSM